MKALFYIFFFLFSFSAFAGRFQVQIDSIDEGKNGEPHLLLMSDGQVGFLPASDEKSLQDLKTLSESDTRFEVELDKDNNVLSMRSLAPIPLKEKSIEKIAPLHLNYDPTTISNEAATQVFSKMRRNYQNNSQCYNRAHIWTYEEFKRSGLKSMKVFMFFTRKYIRNYRYHWWFHVTPAVNTPSGLLALDRRYTKGLLSLRTWSNIFVKSHRACPIISQYYYYRNNQQTEDCYHIPVSMYFWQPRDIAKRDTTGYEKTNYYNSEVNHAYWEAF